MAIIAIYPSECILFQGDYVASRWIEYRFVERPTQRMLMPSGLIKVRNAMPPVEVKAILAKVTEDGRRCILANGNAYDAETVLAMARRGINKIEVLPKRKESPV